MTTEQVWLSAVCAAAATLALVALMLALNARRRAARAESLLATLVERIDDLESAGTGSAADAGASRIQGRDADATTYVITHVDPAAGTTPVARPVDGRLFADIVARETVVKAASWSHGLRRALSAENRNRIRFAVRQETRRAGRGRRAETRQALREFRARERAGDPVRPVGGDAA